MLKQTHLWCLVLLFLAFVLADDDSHDDEFHASEDSHDDDHDHDHEEGDVGLAFLITICAGFASFIGAFAVFCVKREQLAVVPVALGFCSGVVVYLAFMNLIPECVELLYHAGGEESESLAHFFTLLCVIGGIGLAFLSEKCFHHHHVGDETAARDETASAKPDETASTGDSAPSTEATGGDVGM